jgi:hypothetical protein
VPRLKKKTHDERKNMAKDRELGRQVNVKFSANDFENVLKVSRDFGFNISETVRRSTVEGLKKFNRARIPGSPTKEDATTTTP